MPIPVMGLEFGAEELLCQKRKKKRKGQDRRGKARRGEASTQQERTGESRKGKKGEISSEQKKHLSAESVEGYRADALSHTLVRC